MITAALRYLSLSPHFTHLPCTLVALNQCPAVFSFIVICFKTTADVKLTAPTDQAPKQEIPTILPLQDHDQQQRSWNRLRNAKLKLRTWFLLFGFLSLVCRLQYTKRCQKDREKNLYATSTTSILRKQPDAFVYFEFISVKNNPPETLSSCLSLCASATKQVCKWEREYVGCSFIFLSLCLRLVCTLLPARLVASGAAFTFKQMTLNWVWMTFLEIRH